MRRLGPGSRRWRCCPSALLGLWLWRDQATTIWLAGFFAACFDLSANADMTA